MKVAKRRLIEKMSLENCMQWRDLTERKESVTHTSDCRHLMTCRLWDNYQRLWILSMCEKTKSMQTGPKRQYIMAIMADNQDPINCDEWWTNLLFLLNILNGITEQTHSLFESCLSQNPFIIPFMLNNYFRYPFWGESRYLCANFNSRHIHWCKIHVMETEACSKVQYKTPSFLRRVLLRIDIL